MISRVFHFTLPLKAVGQMRARHRVVKTRDGRTFGMTYKATKQRKAEDELRALALSLAPTRLLDGAICLTVQATKKMPDSWSKKKQLLQLGQPCLQKPDLSNIMKHLEDVFNGMFWTDDALIYRYRNCWKRWGNEDSVRIRIIETLTTNTEEIICD